MKLKKILAQSLAAAMVLTSIPVADFTVFAAEDPVAYVSDDAGTVAATETNALPAPYGYKNLQLTVGTDVTITTSGNATDDMKKNLLSTGTPCLEMNNSGDKWIDFEFDVPKTVSGCLYKKVSQTNGHVKIARVDIKTDGSNSYKTVYQTEPSSAWTNDAKVNAALFSTVQNVKNVRFYGVETYYSGEGNKTTLKVDLMSILTTEDASAMTATVSTSDAAKGTATVSIPDSTVSDTTLSVSKGV